MLLKARYVLPVSSPPIENGAVEVREGKVVEARRAAKHEAGAAVIDCGDAVLVPGFVNAHTHLELSDLSPLTAQLEPDQSGRADFTAWLSGVLAGIRAAGDTAESVSEAALHGASLSLAAGVTTVGDITRRPEWTRPALRHGRLRVVSFGEVIAIGAIRDRLDGRLAAAASIEHDSDKLVAGVSPHAPYTCDRGAVRACVRQAAKRKMRLSMHLAETPEEELCTLEGRGPLVEHLRALGVWTDEVKRAGLRPVPYAAELGVLGPRTVIAHANYVYDEDIALLARYGAHVAYCPRTHAAFGHGPHRFRDMLHAGVNVCAGTDSLASNPSLSVLDELRFLRRRFADLDAGLILELGTSRAARALGLEARVGTLEPGKSADVVVIPYDLSGPRDPVENVLGGVQPPTGVYVGGMPIQSEYRRLR